MLIRLVFMRKPTSGIYKVLFYSSILVPLAATVQAQTPPPAAAWIAMDDATFYSALLRSLAMLFVLAVLIELALSVIFNWRLFLEFFSGRGVRTLVMIAVSALVVTAFNVNVVADLMMLYGKNNSGTVSFWLTALILAVGSNGVYNILVALGYRDRRNSTPRTAQPPRNKAWVSVRAVRDQAIGDILVRLGQSSTPPATLPIPLAGVIAPRPFWRRLWSVFFVDRSRFPPTAGYEVESGRPYRLSVEARNAQRIPLPSNIDGDYVFADGAIVDLVVTL